MNRWASMLADTPASLQRLIARANRISLPRRSEPGLRPPQPSLAVQAACIVQISAQQTNRTD